MTDLKLDSDTVDHRAAARHGRGHAGDDRGRRGAVRPRHRPAGRRGHQAFKDRAADRRRARGRKPAQVPAGDERGLARAAGQARRSPAQHAHAAFHQEPGKAPAHRPRDDGDLRPARRAGRDVRIHARDAAARVRAARAGGLCDDHRAARADQEQRRRAGRCASRSRSSRRSPKAACAPRSQGREKHPYSIWRKMAERHIAVRADHRHHGLPRASPRRAEDCYRALGVLHQVWQMVPGRFKDYISTPKRNGYRSLHTTLIYENSMRIEVQIRTPRDAPHQRIRPRRALGLQAGRPARRPGRLAARPDRDRRCQPRCRGAARAHPDGDLPGPHLRLHAQGRAVPATQGLDPGRFRLSRSTPTSARRPSAPRSTRRHMPLRTAAAQRRRGRDHQGQARRAAAFLARLRRHRQGARLDPPRGAGEGARGSRRDRPQAVRRHRRARAGQDRPQGDQGGGRAARVRGRGRVHASRSVRPS